MKFYQNAKFFIQENAFENVVCRNGHHFVQGEVYQHPAGYKLSVVSHLYAVAVLCLCGGLTTIWEMAIVQFGMIMLWSSLRLFDARNKVFVKYRATLPCVCCAGVAGMFWMRIYHEGIFSWELFPHVQIGNIWWFYHFMRFLLMLRICVGKVIFQPNTVISEISLKNLS